MTEEIKEFLFMVFSAGYEASYNKVPLAEAFKQYVDTILKEEKKSNEKF